MKSQKISENINSIESANLLNRFRVRNPSCSLSSTMSTSSTSSANSSLLSNHGSSTQSTNRIVSSSNENFMLGNSNSSPPTSKSANVSATLNSTELVYHDVLIVFPNGFKTVQKIDSRKAIYDLLIELSLAAKLIPTNYTLKLFNQDDNDILNGNSSNIDDETSKTIEYTPNQTIGQLSPSKIKIIPKTATLKHKQLNVTETPLNSNRHSTVITSNSNISNPSTKTTSTHSANHNQNTTNISCNTKSILLIDKTATINKSQLNTNQQPFELTIRVDVNLPFNQRTAVRIKPEISLNDLLSVICKEASLEKSRYDLLIIDTSNSNGDEKHYAHICMNDSFQDYNTKEVTLALKGNNNTNLNSKSSHSLFTQNVLKTRTQPKSYYQNNKNNSSKTHHTIDEQTNLKNRSKSELDLSVKSISSSKNINSSKENINTTCPLSTKNTSSMFGFFSRKKNSDTLKSRTSLNIAASSNDFADLKKQQEKELTKSTKKLDARPSEIIASDQSPNLKIRTKKRPAPAPPVQIPANPQTINNPAQLKPNNNVDINLKTPNQELPIDTLLVEKFLTKKKSKAPPPPPASAPMPTLTIQTQEKLPVTIASTGKLNLLDSETGEKSPVSNIPRHNNNSESTPNISDLKLGSKKKLSVSVSSNSSPQPSLSSTSVSPSLSESHTSISNQSPKEKFADEQHSDINDINNSLIMPVVSNKIPVQQQMLNLISNQVRRNSSTQSNSTFSEHVDDSISTIETLRQKKQNSFKTVSHKTVSNNSSINTIDDVAKSFEKAIDVGEKYLLKYEQSLKNEIELNAKVDAIDANDRSNNNNIINIVDKSYHKDPPSFYNTPSLIDQRNNFSEDEFSDIDSLKVINKSPLSQNNLFNNNMKSRTSNLPKPTTIIIGSDNNFEIKSNSSGSENSSLILDTRIPNVLIESPVSSQNHKTFEIKSEASELSVEPLKRSAVNEVRPEFITTTLISSNSMDQLEKHSPNPTSNVIFRHGNVKTNMNRNAYTTISNNDSLSSSASSSLSPKTSKLLLKTLNQNGIEKSMDNIFVDDSQTNNHKSKTLSILRSPSSPPPQFPAIGANDINELHQNYTVVRSGDIIEKNGTYYSTDGTIRGYSGTVKKIANSTTLNEVFIKQRELEQQHEKEYELEKLQKEQKQAKIEQKQNNSINLNNNGVKHHTISQTIVNNQKNQQQTAIRNSTNQSQNNVTNIVKQQRISLGNIISNEKKSNTNMNTSTLSSNSNIFKQAPFKKQNIQVANNSSNLKENKLSKIDDELTKKLQDRRDIISHAKNQAATNVNLNEPNKIVSATSLEIDTNIKASLPHYSIFNTLSDTSSGSSSTNNESPSLTSTMISPEFPSDPASSTASLNNNRIYTIVNSENNKKKSSLDNSHSSASSTSSQSSSSSSIDMYQQQNQRQVLSSFVMSAKIRTNTLSSKNDNFQKNLSNPDIISQNKSSLLNELKSLIPTIEEHRKQDATNVIPAPPPPLSRQSLLIVPNTPPPAMTTFLPSKVAKAAGTISTSSIVSIQENQKSPPPIVAPKNFNINDNKKMQVLSMRDNLMDSIKGFNLSNLKKISNQ